MGGFWAPSWSPKNRSKLTLFEVASKRRPEAVQESPTSAQERPKSAPRAPQEPPKNAQERRKRVQERPKSVQKRPIESSKHQFEARLLENCRKKRLWRANCRVTESRSTYGTIFDRCSKHAFKRRRSILKRPYSVFFIFSEVASVLSESA